MPRPFLNEEERIKLAVFLNIGTDSSEEEVAHTWAMNYWHNEGQKFINGTPLDGVSVPIEKLVAVAKHFEAEMCSSFR
jgi:hypothetical protein